MDETAAGNRRSRSELSGFVARSLLLFSAPAGDLLEELVDSLQVSVGEIEMRHGHFPLGRASRLPDLHPDALQIIAYVVMHRASSLR